MVVLRICFAMMDQTKKLRTGWTTGACAAAAAKAAAIGLLRGEVPKSVAITLPRGQKPEFAVEDSSVGADWAEAAIRKDAGDDPDVTHQAVIRARLTHDDQLSFHAGPGVGTVTLPGLPIPPGEPAINPVPRRMIDEAVTEIANEFGVAPHFAVTISVPDGEEIATRTWNPRLGIVGGISILGTTGIVRPFSCAAWIASIHRGIDVARANGFQHVLGATGATSEATARALYGLTEEACLDMGDFAGGLMKYLARNPVPHFTLAGGFAKLVKLGQGALDLHSARSQVDFAALAELAKQVDCDPEPIATANTALQALQAAGPKLAEAVAEQALTAVQNILGSAPVSSDVIVVDRAGEIIARAGVRP